MRRRNSWVVLIVLGTAVLVESAGPAAAGISVYANGKPITGGTATVIEGVTYLPLRATAEALGAKLEWMAKTKTAVLCSGNTCYPVRVTDPASGARVVEGRVLLPLRQMAEALGCDVKWEAKTQRVEIKTK